MTRQNYSFVPLGYFGTAFAKYLKFLRRLRRRSVQEVKRVHKPARKEVKISKDKQPQTVLF
jgi:hypothetical protein